MITIKLKLPIVHGTNPHQRVCEAIDHLARIVRNSTPETPALGGAIREPKSGKVIGSYVVEFGDGRTKDDF